MATQGSQIPADETRVQRLERMIREASELADNKRAPASIEIKRDGPMYFIRVNESRKTTK